MHLYTKPHQKAMKLYPFSIHLVLQIVMRRIYCLVSPFSVVLLLRDSLHFLYSYSASVLVFALFFSSLLFSKLGYRNPTTPIPLFSFFFLMGFPFLPPPLRL
uniref:Uncharacterized protein n=1 Tax=Cucumis sativus TaxID=3659 RepID=A0A0A0KDU8_CUCSA